MALEVSAAIIGILAAAGKVAESLGPIVSAFKNAPSHAHTIHTEVRYTRTILLGLQRLFDELTVVPTRRKQLIPIDQLVAALTDGVLLFSELETLVDGLGDPKEALTSRAKWARKDDEMNAIVNRLLGFKTSIVLMLGILRCESDLVAQFDRQILLENTARILEKNLELSQRLANVENRLCTTHSIITARPESRATTTTEHHVTGNGASKENQVVGPCLSGEFTVGVQFEVILKASRVYRKTRRDSTDHSFCSSIPVSHAWTALSDISLSDISAISVVALPLQSSDIANGHHYYFTEVVLDSGDGDQTEVLGYPSGLASLSQHYSGTEPTKSSILPPVLSSTAVTAISLSTQLRIHVYGGPDPDIHRLIEEFTAEASTPKIDSFATMMSFKTVCIIDGIRVYLEIVVSDSTETGPIHCSIQTGKLFMFVYNVASHLSFEKIRRLSYRLVHCQGYDDEFPGIIVGLPTGDERLRQVSYAEGQLLADRSCCDFLEATNTQAHPFREPIVQLVRKHWAYEAKQTNQPKVERSLSSKLLGERNARRLRLLRADRPLSAVQEI